MGKVRCADTHLCWICLIYNRQYGALMHYRVGLQDFIVVSDGHVARELLDKRRVSSGRPSARDTLIFAQDLANTPQGPRQR